MLASSIGTCCLNLSKENGNKCETDGMLVRRVRMIRFESHGASKLEIFTSRGIASHIGCVALTLERNNSERDRGRRERKKRERKTMMEMMMR